MLVLPGASVGAMLVGARIGLRVVEDAAGAAGAQEAVAARMAGAGALPADAPAGLVLDLLGLGILLRPAVGARSSGVGRGSIAGSRSVPR